MEKKEELLYRQCSNKYTSSILIKDVFFFFFFFGFIFTERLCSLIMVIVKSVDNDIIAYIKLSNNNTLWFSIRPGTFDSFPSILSSFNCVACCCYSSCCWYFIGRNARLRIHIEDCVGKNGRKRRWASAFFRPRSRIIAIIMLGDRARPNDNRTSR
jgi:hypothetical protein